MRLFLDSGKRQMYNQVALPGLEKRMEKPLYLQEMKKAIKVRSVDVSLDGVRNVVKLVSMTAPSSPKLTQMWLNNSLLHSLFKILKLYVQQGITYTHPTFTFLVQDILELLHTFV